jgi:hypothetical protein
MSIWQKAGLALLLASALTLSGCKKKPPSSITRLPQAPPPVPSQPAPEPPVSELPPVNDNVEAAESAPTATSPAMSKPRSVRRPARQTPAPAPTESQPPARTAVEEGSAAEPSPTISARMPQDQAANTRQQTAHLLDQTEANLRKLTRELNEPEKAMVQQIRTYVADSRAATAAGDLVRAQTLALKAHLLSQELVK